MRAEAPAAVTGDTPSRGQELRTFFFLAIVIGPVIAVGAVGGIGLAIWIFQMFAGPPGPPAA